MRRGTDKMRNRCRITETRNGKIGETKTKPICRYSITALLTLPLSFLMATDLVQPHYYLKNFKWLKIQHLG